MKTSPIKHHLLLLFLSSLKHSKLKKSGETTFPLSFPLIPKNHSSKKNKKTFPSFLLSFSKQKMVNLIPKPLENETVNDQLLEETNKVLGNGKKQGKKFAVLLCAEDSEYVKKKYEGYFGVFVRMLGEEGESWDVYRVAGNEFPNEKELGMYDGFVITGSCSDAHSNELWICKLLNLLKVLDSLKKKVLGICFGHQVIFCFFFLNNGKN